MSSEKAPAFQFYPKDFIVDTAHMSAEEAGAYWRLCCYGWVGVPGCEQGTLPKDPNRLSRWAGVTQDRWDEIGAAVMEPWQGHGDPNSQVIRHRRLQRELEKQAERRAKLSAAGKKGADKRWGDSTDGVGHAEANGEANGEAKATPMASDSPASASASSPSTSRSRPDAFHDTVAELSKGNGNGSRDGSEKHRVSPETLKNPWWQDHDERGAKVMEAMQFLVGGKKLEEYALQVARVRDGPHRDRVYEVADDILADRRSGDLDHTISRSSMIKAINNR